MAFAAAVCSAPERSTSALSVVAVRSMAARESAQSAAGGRLGPQWDKVIGVRRAADTEKRIRADEWWRFITFAAAACGILLLMRDAAVMRCA